MKLRISLILFVALMSMTADNVLGQTGNAAQTADEIRLKLLEIEGKEAALQARARQLDEALKPENIERSLAGVGSTRPEELRELRRRQLSIERDSVGTQLRILASNRQQLEASLRNAENAAYQQSAEGSLNETMRAENTSNPVVLAGMLIGLGAILGTLFVTAIVRKVGLPARRVINK